LLLDDELPGLTYLKMLCEQFPELEVVKAFNNPANFVKELPELEFDLCIMDIEMPEMSGLQVTNLLQGKPVIFTTAYKEYAADAFDLDAIDYLVKPVRRERLQQAIRKVADRVEKKSRAASRNFVQFNTDKGKALIFFDQLAYIRTSETDSRDKIARLADGEEIVLKNISFDKLTGLLPKADFCRINKREMIALKTVQVFSFDEITTLLRDAGGKPLKLVLGESYRSEFLQKVKI